MNKIKITSIVVVSILIGVVATNFAGAATLDGRVEAEVSGWIGTVTPNIAIDNQTITLNVNMSGDGENATYIVEDELYIELNSTDNTGREQFWMPRAIVYSVIAIRKLMPFNAVPFRSGLLNRFLPIRNLLGSKNVVDSMLGVKDNNITIPLDYEISKTIFENGENLTMHFFVMGFVPGEANGLSEGIPIIAHKSITLEIKYGILM